MTEETLSARDYKITLENYNCFFSAWLRKNNFTPRKFIIAAIIAIFFAYTGFQPILADLLKQYQNGTKEIGGFLIYMCIAIPIFSCLFAAIVMFMISPLLSYLIQTLGFLFGPVGKRVNSIEISSEYIRKTADDRVNELGWDGIYDIAETDKTILLFTNKNCALIIPKRAFESPQAAEQFVIAASAYWHHAKV